MKLSYYAVFQYDSDGICILFPDVPPALTCADNEPDGMKYAEEALELALHGLPVDEVPQASSAGQIGKRKSKAISYNSAVGRKKRKAV